MFRTLSHLAAASALAAALLWTQPADACAAHAAKAEVPSAQKAADKAPDKTAASSTGKAASSPNVLAPVDEVLSATCSCSGPSDCTCKKGQCKCKKCSKHHGVKSGAGSTRLMEPLQHQRQSPTLPKNAAQQATGGVLI